jgi:hypothetical protein
MPSEAVTVAGKFLFLSVSRNGATRKRYLQTVYNCAFNKALNVDIGRIFCFITPVCLSQFENVAG